jgi:pimeloyl-ACP methyl ester carboxylesterase
VPSTGGAETRYAKGVDGVELAYRIVDDGPVDVLWSFSQLSDVEAIWGYPPIAAFIHALGASARIVVHDRRGMGRSGGEHGDLATDVADLLGLLDAVGAERAYLAGAVIGGATYAAFAREHPERVAGLIWHGPFARLAWAPGYPWGATTEELDAYAEKLAEGWGTEPFAADFVAGGAPSMAGHADSVRYFAHWMRQTSDARAAAAYTRRWDAVDLHPLLREVRVPTLITNRGSDPGEAAHVASLIPGARFITFEGQDFMPFFDSAPILGAIRQFLGSAAADR